jgi:hypothetical protein
MHMTTSRPLNLSHAIALAGNPLACMCMCACMANLTPRETF